MDRRLHRAVIRVLVTQFFHRVLDGFRHLVYRGLFGDVFAPHHRVYRRLNRREIHIFLRTKRFRLLDRRLHCTVIRVLVTQFFHRVLERGGERVDLILPQPVPPLVHRNLGCLFGIGQGRDRLGGICRQIVRDLVHPFLDGCEIPLFRDQSVDGRL